MFEQRGLLTPDSLLDCQGSKKIAHLVVDG